MATDTPNGTGTESFASVEAAMGAYQDDTEREDRETDTQAGEPIDEAGTQSQAGPDDDTDDEFGEVEEHPDEVEADESSPDYAGGRFAADNANVKLTDGTVTTVAELRKASLRQSDYTRKATEIAQERKAIAEKETAFASEREQVKSFAAELQRQRETVAFLAQALMPKEPDIALVEHDIIGYNLQKAAYDKQAKAIGELVAQHQQHQKRQGDETAAEQTEARKREAKALREKWPDFFDPHGQPNDKYGKFWRAAVAAAPQYGISPEELNELTDHRYYLVLRDALAYRRIKAKNAATTGKPQTSRPVITGGRQGTNGSAQQDKRAAAQARFQRNPSIHNAIDLID
jgi:hypothetical protein